MKNEILQFTKVKDRKTGKKVVIDDNHYHWYQVAFLKVDESGQYISTTKIRLKSLITDLDFKTLQKLEERLSDNRDGASIMVISVIYCGYGTAMKFIGRDIIVGD